MKVPRLVMLALIMFALFSMPPIWAEGTQATAFGLEALNADSDFLISGALRLNPFTFADKASFEIFAGEQRAKLSEGMGLRGAREELAATDGSDPKAKAARRRRRPLLPRFYQR
jgi:hypothetical protein